MKHQFRNSRLNVATLMALSAMLSISAAGTASDENPMGVSAPRHPVKYEVLEKSNINNEMKEAGDTVMYEGLPAENLKPLCDIGRARYQEYLVSNKSRVDKMVADANNTDLNKMQQDLMTRLAEKQLAAIEAQPAQIGAAVAQAVAQTLAAMFPAGFPSAAAAPADIPVVAAPVGEQANSGTPAGDSATKSAKK